MRIFLSLCVSLSKAVCMKVRVNLTIDEEVLQKAKKYAAASHTSVSEMVQAYLAVTARMSEKKTVASILRRIPKPKADYSGRNLIKEYFEAQNKK